MSLKTVMILLFDQTSSSEDLIWNSLMPIPRRLPFHHHCSSVDPRNSIQGNREDNDRPHNDHLRVPIDRR